MSDVFKTLILTTLGAFLSTAGCSFIFGAPKKLALINGLNGAFGFVVYSLLVDTYGNLLSTFIAGVFITLVAQIVARILRTPVTVCLVPSFYPLVPGGLLYRAVYAFVDNDLALSSENASQAMLVAGVIALSILLTESAFILLLRSAKKIKRLTLGARS